jgi:Fels-1 Prophage Protein-like
MGRQVRERSMPTARPWSLKMHRAIGPLVLCLTLVCSACGTPQLSFSTGGTPTWSDSSLYRAHRDPWLALPGYGRSPLHRPSIACDQFGRCWQLGPFDRLGRGYSGRSEARPPGWAERLPDSAETHNRFLRPRSELLCDRATGICYKEGKIDKSDTERIFGERAADRADGLRDRHGTGRLFVPERDVSCDRDRRVCLDDGDPDRSLTRRYFGRRAARAIQEERPDDGGARPAKRKSKRKER